METNQNDRLRILVNGLSARRGGVQTYLINLLRLIPEDAPIDIFVIAPDSLPVPTDRENIKRVPVNWPVENPFVRAVWERICLPKLLQNLGVNVLFCPGGIIGAILPPGCKSVVMFRNMLPFDHAQRRRYPLGYMRTRLWILERVLLKSMLRADMVIFISEFAREVIQARSTRFAGNTVVIPHGINPAFRNGESVDLPRPEWLPPEEYFLYVSDVDFYKSHLEVVQAYALLKQRRLTRESLVLVGYETRDYGREVRREIRRLGLDGHVIMAGKIPYEQMPALYHNALVNIYASQCENCPNILLEALAAGRPVIASNRAPMPEFAGDGAIYFDPTSPPELAGQLARLLDDPSQMQELSAKARERSRRYDWLYTSAATWKLIEGCAK